ncbi:helix-turn-helix transcriptional regulator [Yoonia litorea]|uniref:Regulatory protein, luxR family n=1 Tax=Yoonia litorea TaxID=1123755 RepID=A0A1I6MLF4_9RHOB|nr:LuxR C-terminal-related transcriptional regulator [Yoonia litorea]SFS16533.1 regulatory protein, luxR family [Yoonia litorea]
MTRSLSVAEASDLIGIVYDASLEKNQWASLVGALIAQCPGHVAAVVTFEDARWVSSHVPTLPDGEHGAQISELMEDVEKGDVAQPDDLNDTLFHRQPLEIGTLYSTRRIFSEEEFRNFEGYKATMKPIGAGHWTGTHFSITGGRRAAVMVVENDFDETPKDNARVEDIIRLIAPHMIRANTFARALSMAKDAAETYSAFIDAIALPMLIMTRDGQFQMANTIGQRLLDTGELVQLDTATNRIALPETQDTAKLSHAIAQAQEDGGPHAFQAFASDTSIAVCVCPYRPALAFASEIDRKLFKGQQLFAVFIGAKPQGDVSSRLLQDAFGLTQREAEVCGGLLGGRKPSQLAVEMGRSEKTIRNQIQAVHEKVGVTSTRDLTEALSVFRTVGAMFAEDGGAA